jgi:APA family basic amino acid/polyamine antiporter
MRKKFQSPVGAAELKESITRPLSALDVALVLCGNTIASGIFLTGGTIARGAPNPGAYALVWIFAGVLVGAGLLTFSELGTRLPESGGQYVFLREAYGRKWAFLFGWTSLLIYHTGGLAAVAVGFGRFLARLLFDSDAGVPIVWVGQLQLSAANILAVAAILGLSVMQCRGLKESARLQIVLEAATILGIVAVALAVISRGAHANGPIASWTSGWPFVFRAPFWGTAMIAALWTFDGWDRGSWLSGDIRNPQRNVPLAMLGGGVVVFLLYAAANYAWLSAMSMVELQRSTNPAADITLRLFGAGAEHVLDTLVAVATLSCVNAVILAGPRLYQRMAADGLFFALDSPDRGQSVPIRSIQIQAVWASILAISGSYEDLIGWVTVAALGLHALAAASLFRIRSRKIGRAAGFRVPAYPLTPLVFIGACLFIMADSFLSAKRGSLFGIGLVFLGWPVYELWTRRRFPESLSEDRK